MRAARDRERRRGSRQSTRSCPAGTMACGNGPVLRDWKRAPHRPGRSELWRFAFALSSHAPSPGDLLLGAFASRLRELRAHLGHARLDLLSGDDLLLDDQVAHGTDPFLVVGGAVVL